MAVTQQFTDVLREWTEVFMRHSMGGFRDFTRQTGLSMSQLGALFRISHCGTCDVSDISEHLGVTNAATSQMVDRLVQQGLLDRSEDPDDRRVKILVLTPEGQDIVLAAVEARRTWIQGLTEALTPEQQETIASALTILNKAARELEQSSMPALTVNNRRSS